MVFLPVKIKIVGMIKPSRVQRVSRAKRDIRPYDIRVKRDHGCGLWTLEGNDGQLYLAVLSPLSDSLRKAREEERRSAGTEYSRGA